MCLLAREIARPLQWVVCQLHYNELPLRHLIKHLDGPTTGPQGISGPIGKMLSNCVHLPINETFVQILGNFPINEKNVSVNFSTDQKYLKDICLAVASGHCSPTLANKKHGKLSHGSQLPADCFDFT
ncbi:hypothetical protein AVEN_266369-1 [Araneus ventricosus]|uniref:Uncharacterized protein n=1 Tax=Araneus ventricosus TaxID=182803 RepID=A0A4Y2CQK4_ARAVE|nr:hypothetical protein AVEN_266369-1 [Araneus ventricosus]